MLEHTRKGDRVTQLNRGEPCLFQKSVSNPPECADPRTVFPLFSPRFRNRHRRGPRTDPERSMRRLAPAFWAAFLFFGQRRFRLRGRQDGRRGVRTHRTSGGGAFSGAVQQRVGVVGRGGLTGGIGSRVRASGSGSLTVHGNAAAVEYRIGSGG